MKVFKYKLTVNNGEESKAYLAIQANSKAEADRMWVDMFINCTCSISITYDGVMTKYLTVQEAKELNKEYVKHIKVR